MFKVLVIAYHFPPLGLSGVQRTFKFVKYFGLFNWSATVITSGKISYYAYDEELLRELNSNNVEIIRTESIDINKALKKKGKVEMPSSVLLRLLDRVNKTFFIPDNKKLWSRKAAKIALNKLDEETFDAIYISVPPFSTVLPFIRLKEKYDIPLFIDYRDSWFTNQFRFYPTPYHRYKHKKLEDSVLRKADRIIVVNRIIKEDLLKNYKFLDFKDIDIIPHGFDPEDYDGVTEIPKDNNKMIISFSGVLSGDITPSFLLKAFKKLTKESPEIASNIEIRFIGIFNKENRKLVKRLKLEPFVKEYGFLTHKEAIRLIISSDILWLMLPNKDRMNNVTPGKLFEYFAARKPIIASLPESAAKFNAEKYGAAFLTEPDNINQIKDTIVEVHEKFINGKLPVPYEEFVSQFDRKLQAEQLIKIFQFYLKEE